MFVYLLELFENQAGLDGLEDLACEGGNASLHHQDGAANRLLLHAVDVISNRSNTDTRIIGEENKNLISGIVLLGSKDRQALTGSATELLLELLRAD